MGTFGERSGLIKNDSGKFSGGFKCRTVADEQTIGRRKRCGNGDYQRDSHAQCVRAGRYHYRHHSFKRKGNISTACIPIGKCAYAHGNGNKGEPFGNFVRKVLRIGLSSLCLLHKIDNPVQVAVFSNGCYLNFQRTIAIDRACDDLFRPFPFTGTLSPVSILSLIYESPSSTNPSAGIFSPGFMIAVSPLCRSSSFIFTASPPRSTVTSLGSKATNDCNAREAAIWGTHFQPMP